MNKDKEKETSVDNDFIELKADVQSGFAAIEQQMKTIFSTLDKIEKTINGNGNPGLVERSPDFRSVWTAPGRRF